MARLKKAYRAWLLFCPIYMCETDAMWMSDGTGSGDDGDLMVKITAGGVTKTATLIDFSAV